MDSSASYISLEDSDKEEALPFVNSANSLIRTSTRRPRLPWILSTVGFAILSLFLLNEKRASRIIGKYETGFKTEFEPAALAIQLERVRFSGTPLFRENGTAYRKVNANEPQYVGPPSDEIDSAWAGLIHGRYVSITEDEARNAWGENYEEYYQDPVLGFVAGLDVIHTLHCVNRIRKEIDRDYYFREDQTPGGYDKEHVYHCIDILRQTVQCYGDITPIPIRWFDGIDRGFIDSDQVHTCRDFRKVREWVTERFNRTPAKLGRNQD